jgi:hypothetical protein
MASPSGGTASFSLLYIILSILRDHQASRLMELGVGQSTSLLVQYISKVGGELVLIDDDQHWLDQVAGQHANVNAIHATLVPSVVGDKTIAWYDCGPPDSRFDFLLIDGPKAHTRGWRYNRFGILNWLPQVLEDEFVMLIDDTNRIGEFQLALSIASKLDQCGIQVGTRDIVGGNSQIILATRKYAKYLYL